MIPREDVDIISPWAQAIPFLTCVPNQTSPELSLPSVPRKIMDFNCREQRTPNFNSAAECVQVKLRSFTVYLIHEVYCHHFHF